VKAVRLEYKQWTKDKQVKLSALSKISSQPLRFSEPARTALSMSDTSGSSVNTESSAGVSGGTPWAPPASIVLQSGLMDGGQGHEGFGSASEGDVEREVEREGGGGGESESIPTAVDIEREGEERREWLIRQELGGAREAGSQETEQLSGVSRAIAGIEMGVPGTSGMSVQTEARTTAALPMTPGGSVVVEGSSVLTVPMVDVATVTETETDIGARVEAEAEGEGEGEALLVETESVNGMSPSFNTALYNIDMATADSTVTVADSESVADRLAAIHVATLSTEDIYSAADETDDGYLSSLNYSFVSFISFPFVLSSSSKAAVLECDATQQMRRGKADLQMHLCQLCPR
jgi:hypothetical protein